MAARQRGVVTRAQLAAAGVSAKEIGARLRSGHLHPVHRGVYLVGHPAFAPLGRETAALLALGPGSVLSHRTAATIHELLPPAPSPVHVTKAGSHRRAPPGVVVHRVRSVPPQQRRLGLPLTSVVRTLVDLALDPGLSRAFNEAQVRRMVTPDQLAAAIPTGGRGAARLRRLLSSEPAPTRSALERRLLRLVADARLPAPETNTRVAGYEVDALWPDQRLVLELDGWAAHGTRAAFEQDRRKQADLTAAGYAVCRLTWRQVTREPSATAADLAAALVRRNPKNS